MHAVEIVATYLQLANKEARICRSLLCLRASFFLSRHDGSILSKEPFPWPCHGKRVWFQHPDQRWQARCRPGRSKRSEASSLKSRDARGGGAAGRMAGVGHAATGRGPGRRAGRPALMAPPRTRVLSRFPVCPGEPPPPPGRAGALGTHPRPSPTPPPTPTPRPRSMQPCRLVRLWPACLAVSPASCQAVSAALSLTCGDIGSRTGHGGRTSVCVSSLVGR